MARTIRGKGWHGESRRHDLARQGIKTATTNTIAINKASSLKVKHFPNWGRTAKNADEKRKEEIYYRAAQSNGWVTGRFAMEEGDFIVEEDRLNRNSFIHVDTKTELKKAMSHGNLTLGTAIIYKDLCFIQQINGGDEWATYSMKGDKATQFESISFLRIIEDKEFTPFINRLERAKHETRLDLEY